jgi:hypothetical protein
MWASGINRSSNVGSAAVPLQADRDDLVTFGERGMNRPKHLTRSQPAVQQDQRTPFPDRLAIEIDAVDVGVLAGTLCRLSNRCWSRCAPRGAQCCWVVDLDSAVRLEWSGLADGFR